MEYRKTWNEERWVDKMKPGIRTIADIQLLPDGEHAELINGELFMMAPPSVRHQRIIRDLSTRIFDYIKSKNGTCEVLWSPIGVVLTDDGKNYLEPDIIVVCDKSKLNDEYCMGAPDWVIEVVSPSSTTMDYMRKMDEYHKAGVREYWIVDPLQEKTTVYHWNDQSKQTTQDEMKVYDFGVKIKVEIYEDFYLIPS